jgi:hypothetical protein
MNTTHTEIARARNITLARGLGRLAFRTHGTTRGMHLVVQDAVRAYPELDGFESEIRVGWYAEREDMGCSQRPE